MDEIDALLDALWNAALEGDFEAAIFLQMFAPWASEAPRVPKGNSSSRYFGD